MSTSATAGDRDLRTLADIVSADRSDLPAGEGLPPSLLADLMDQIRCDVISFEGFDSKRQETWLLQSIPGRGGAIAEDLDPVHWEHYWDCQPCSYPDRTGDLRSIITIADFYSARQWHSVGTYCDIYRPQGLEHDLMLTLPAAPGLRREAHARSASTAAMAVSSAAPVAISAICQPGIPPTTTVCTCAAGGGPGGGTGKPGPPGVR